MLTHQSIYLEIKISITELRPRMAPACIILFRVNWLGSLSYKHMLLASWLSRAAPFYDAVTAKMVGPGGICEGCLESSYSSFELRKEMMTVYLLARSNRPSVPGAKIQKAFHPLRAVSKAGVNPIHILRREMMAVHSSIRVWRSKKLVQELEYIKLSNPLNICSLKIIH